MRIEIDGGGEAATIPSEKDENDEDDEDDESKSEDAEDESEEDESSEEDDEDEEDRERAKKYRLDRMMGEIREYEATMRWWNREGHKTNERPPTPPPFIPLGLQLRLKD